MLSELISFINLQEGESYNMKNTARKYPAFALLLLGTCLKEIGFKIKIYDQNVIDIDYEEILRCNPLFIGLSVMTTQIPEALSVSREIKKKNSKVKIVWGGPHASLFPKETLSSDLVDIVVINEGVKSAKNLALSLSNVTPLKNISGIGYKAKGKIIINEPEKPDEIKECPHIDFTLLGDIEKYTTNNTFAKHYNGNKESRLFPIITGLGCCYKCSFCINVAFKRKYRFRTADDIVSEIERLQKDYNANSFVFQDEDFFISKKRFFKFLDLIEEKNLKIKWRTWGRANYFNEDYLSRNTVKRLSDLGLMEIAIGAESGNQEVLDKIINKGIKVHDILNSAEYMKNTSIIPRYSFIYGFPGETRHQLIDTFSVAKEIIKINIKAEIAGPFMLRLYPGSPMYNNILKKYKIKAPKSIDEWAEAYSYQGYLGSDYCPWMPENNLKLVSFLIFLLDVFRYPGNMGSLRYYFTKFYRPIAEIRFKGDFFRITIEYFLVRLLRNLKK